MIFKKRQIVRDGRGNYFAIDRVNETFLELHSVATKETWAIDTDYAFLTLEIVQGLREA